MQFSEYQQVAAFANWVLHLPSCVPGLLDIRAEEKMQFCLTGKGDIEKSCSLLGLCRLAFQYSKCSPFPSEKVLGESPQIDIHVQTAGVLSLRGSWDCNWPMKCHALSMVLASAGGSEAQHPQSPWGKNQAS